MRWNSFFCWVKKITIKTTTKMITSIYEPMSASVTFVASLNDISFFMLYLMLNSLCIYTNNHKGLLLFFTWPQWFPDHGAVKWGQQSCDSDATLAPRRMLLTWRALTKTPCSGAYRWSEEATCLHDPTRTKVVQNISRDTYVFECDLKLARKIKENDFVEFQ